MTRRTIFSVFTAAAVTTMLALPGIAAANTYWHSTNDEVGAKAHPEHFQSGKTRAQVRAEAAAAVRDGGDSRFFANNYPAAVNDVGAGSAGRESSPEDRLLGRQGFASQASRVVDVSKNPEYLNIVCGETVVFTDGKAQFAWKFDGIGHKVVDLAAIAPAGFASSSLKVYVAKNTLERA